MGGGNRDWGRHVGWDRARGVAVADRLGAPLVGVLHAADCEWARLGVVSLPLKELDRSRLVIVYCRDWD